MQRLKEDKLVNFHPDTMVSIRKLYQLDKPGQMDEAIDNLEAWVSKQEHFKKKKFSREYLERVIIQLKGSVERAKSQLDKICTIRTMMPKFFTICDPQKDMKDLSGYVSQTLLPNLTKDNHRMYIIRINGSVKHTPRKFFLIYVYCILINEYIKSHDYHDGLIIICDMRGVQITDFIAALNLTELRQVVTIVMEGYDARIKSINFISTSKTINVLINILKQMLSSKIADRINIHNTVEELHGNVPRELLPKDYGGHEKTLDELNEHCLKFFSSKENLKLFKEMREACTDESRRSVCTFNETYLGLAGTFRTLNVD